MHKRLSRSRRSGSELYFNHYTEKGDEYTFQVFQLSQEIYLAARNSKPYMTIKTLIKAPVPQSTRIGIPTAGENCSDVGAGHEDRMRSNPEKAKGQAECPYLSESSGKVAVN